MAHNAGRSDCVSVIISLPVSVSSAAMLCEHLESMASMLGLRYNANHSGTEAYISSEMFYVSLSLDASGGVPEVKIAHGGEPVVGTAT